MSNLALHLSHHVASALGRQFAFADYLGERSWSVDIGSGAVTFGNDLTFPIQLLGTESHGNGTWLWAWANTQSNLPPDLLRAVEWIRDYGRDQGVSELTDRSFPLATADGHKLSLLAAGLTGCGYYRGPYEGGALFFLVEGLPATVLAPVPPVRVIRVLTEALQAYELDHRVVVESFLSQQGFALSSDAATTAASHANGSRLQVAFDGHGRVARFDANLVPG
jgi:hypothetical protein